MLLDRFAVLMSCLLVTASIGRAQITVVSAASFNPDGVLAPGSIASAFGESLAPAVEIASETPLPTSLQGIRVTVTDLALQTMDCPLFFVSPAQINFLLPEGLAEGPGTIRVRTAAGLTEEGPGQTVQEGTITLARTAPGLFNQTDLNWAAAFLLRVDSDGTQTRESIYHAPEGVIVPRLLELSPGGDESADLYLELYGTGFANAGGAEEVTTYVGNSVGSQLGDVDIVPTLFAGSQGSIGLDQVTAGPLDRRIEFFGGGDSPIAIIAGPRASNVVWMQVAPNPNAPAILNLDIALVPGEPPSVRYGFDFEDGDGDLGPFRVVISWTDATRICTASYDIPGAEYTGQTSGRVEFELRKPLGTQLVDVEAATVTVSDPAGHVSNFANWTGTIAGFQEECVAEQER